MMHEAWHPNALCIVSGLTILILLASMCYILFIVGTGGAC